MIDGPDELLSVGVDGEDVAVLGRVVLEPTAGPVVLLGPIGLDGSRLVGSVLSDGVESLAAAPVDSSSTTVIPGSLSRDPSSDPQATMRIVVASRRMSGRGRDVAIGF